MERKHGTALHPILYCMMSFKVRSNAHRTRQCVSWDCSDSSKLVLFSLGACAVVLKKHNSSVTVNLCAYFDKSVTME